MQQDGYDGIQPPLEAFVGRLADAVGLKPGERKAGWNMLHIDSWEMGPQNWCDDFREQFEKRRGYDPLPYMAVVSGVVVGNREISERFLWDYRMTAQELVLENHARHLKRVAHRYGMGLSIEPYDMSPNNDIALGSIADVPMCEFWEKDDVFNSAFSCIEATSAAHTNNRPIVGAEAFTSGIGDYTQRQQIVADESRQYEGSGRLGLLHRNQPFRVPPLCTSAVAGSFPGHDDGPLRCTL